MASWTKRSTCGNARSSTCFRRNTARVGKMPAVVDEVIAGRFELEELVGKGGMSSVYRAQDRLLERTVAIKLLHEHYSRDEDYVERVPPAPRPRRARPPPAPP